MVFLYKKLIDSVDDADIKAQSFTNDNNFVISFYNFGRYIHRILIFY